MATHLVIGDPHSTPKSPNDRFLWAGKFARDIKADVIICMGDFASMDSLSSYDKGKKSFEGRRYKKDIEHAHDALEKFNRGLLGNGRKKNGQRRIMLLGNHEDRIDRAIDNTPELDGAISIDDLEYDGMCIITRFLLMWMVYTIVIAFQMEFLEKLYLEKMLVGLY